MDKWIELSEKTFNFACYARYWFANGDTQTKREILAGLGSNLTLINKTVRVDLEKPLQFIGLAVNEESTISKMFEPEEQIDLPANLEDLWSKNPFMLPSPRISIQANLSKAGEQYTNDKDSYEEIIRTFQDLRYMGELRQRWFEIKKLSQHPVTVA